MLFRVCIAVIVLALAFTGGAFQHRQGGWPFGGGTVSSVVRVLGFAPEDERIHREKIAYWISQLRKGGYLVYIRHAHREKWPNVTAFDLYERANGIEDASLTSFKRGVCLSDMGVEEAKLLGKLFEKYGVNVGAVHTSPSCRAKQTATFAFGKYDAIDNALFALSLHEYLGKPDPLLDFLKNVEIKSGRNTILVGHNNRLEPHEGKGIAGKFPQLQEPGLHILERTADKKLTVVFSIQSLHDLAVHGGLAP